MSTLVETNEGIMTAAVATDQASPFSVEARAVCRRYGRRWALVNVDLQVRPGRAMMICGRNGSGKSTLLRVLSTALRADRGEVLIDGFDAHEDRDEVRRRIAILGHYPYTYEALTALQNLQVPARLMGLRSDRESLLPLLEQVGLTERADDTILSFSAGMRKRIALARMLLQATDLVPPVREGAPVQRANVVMLDEPYGQLDPPGFRFVDGLFRLLRAQGVTVLLATHLLDRGSMLCDDGIVLERGQRVWSGPARDLPIEGGLDPVSLPEGGA